MKTVYICHDTVTGVFSAIYDAWKDGRREEDCGIVLWGELEQELFCEYRETEETERKARAVERLIREHLGMRAYRDIYYAALSGAAEKGDAILGTMRAARELPDSRRIMEHLSHPKVERVFELSRAVGGEAHNYKGFLRFRELAGGILYGEITPKNQILTCIAPHFADRFPLENWMICDKTHKMFVVHEAGKRWVLVWDEEFIPPTETHMSEKEREYAGLWKDFCRAISVRERENPRCQQTHLPLRYRPDMVEFALSCGGTKDC